MGSDLESTLRKFILETFVVTADEAATRASGLIELISAKGGDLSRFDSTRIKALALSTYNGDLEWRDKSRQAAYIQEKKDRLEDIKQVLKRRRKHPGSAFSGPSLKKW